MTSWNPGDPPDPNQPPQYGQQPPPPPQYGQQPPPPPQYGQQPPPQYGQQPPPPPPYGQQPPPQYGQQPPPQYGAQPYPVGPNPYGAPVGPGQPADIGKRVFGYLIDVVMIGVLFGILFGIALAVFVTSATCGYDQNNIYQCSGGSGGGIVVLLYFVLFGAALLYPVYFLGAKGATIGMKLMGIKVVDADTGELIGYGRAFIRTLLFSICIIVALSSLFDSSPRKQGWHDKAANAVVVTAK